MTYCKPEFSTLGSAITAVQMIDSKLTPNVTDIFVFSPLYPMPTITPAYDADE